MWAACFHSSGGDDSHSSTCIQTGVEDTLATADPHHAVRYEVILVLLSKFRFRAIQFITTAFICGLYVDAINISDYTASINWTTNEKRIANHMEQNGRDLIYGSVSRHPPGGTEENYEKTWP